MTKDWELFTQGKLYNQRLEPNYYETVDANLDFFSGNQWRNLPDSDMPKPVFNIIKRVITFQVASLTTSKAKIRFEPLMYSKDTPDPKRQMEANGAEIANKQVSSLMEKFKMEFKIKDALFDAAITGDAAAHFYFDTTKQPYGTLEPNIKGEICMELVDGSNVMFGNANNNKTEVQPYIIISGRDMVQNLKDEAKRYSESEESITSDTNYQYQSGLASRIEVKGDESGKALYIIVYRKVKKSREVMGADNQPVTEEYTTITASKSVENAYIYQDIDTGLSSYPVAWMNWEKQKNQYHGRALCTGILPNQIFINRMFAMVMYHLMMTAFPKAVYNADLIDIWDNTVGSAIPITGMGIDTNIKNIAGYLEPGNMSNQIVQVIDLAMQYTKETLGISDAALGNIDPKNTSAIIAVQKSSAIPLENPKANLYEWIEDQGKILFDMMGTNYGPRPVMTDDGVLEMFDFSQLKDMWLDVKADVGESSYWSEIASGQTLDNLLANGHLDIIQYLERAPDEMIPQKQELIAELKDRMAMMQQQQQMQQPDPQAAAMAQQDQQATSQQQMEHKRNIDMHNQNLKAHQQNHNQQVDLAKLALDAKKLETASAK